jgi:hypothetical protein
MAPENVKGEYSPLLSEYLQNLGLKKETSNKLIPNLRDKIKYMVHYRLLKLYLRHGLKLKKVHQVISFDQEAWLEPYITFNTQQRAKAKNEFEKNFFKLMNNSVYGKCCENIRKHMNMVLTNSEKRLQKLANKPKFKDFTIIKEDELIAVEMAKTEIEFNKPVYVGMSVLELSKLLMYQFHYDVMKPKYGDKINLMFTDTDSLFYEIETEDVFKDFLEMKDKFDFSDYSKDHICYDPTNKKVLAKFKDEANGKIIIEFIGLRPKSYSYLIDGDVEEHKRAKGVKQNVTKNDLDHESYRNALFGNSKEDLLKQVSFNVIRSNLHQVSTMKVEKIGLSCLDNKRFVMDDNINTLALGHFAIQELTNDYVPRKSLF